jgi:hypothetical protein
MQPKLKEESMPDKVEFRDISGTMKCPKCNHISSVALPVPVISSGKVSVVKEIFCTNQFCEAKLQLTAQVSKRKKDTEEELKITRFLANGEDKEISQYWQSAN